MMDPIPELPNDHSGIFQPGPKQILTARENELYALVRKRGLSVQQIIQLCQPTPHELAWMWELDRKSWLRHLRDERLKKKNKL